jgi:hypothetical protein
MFTTCKGTSKLFIQVCQCKFTLWKIKLREIFSEFLRIFPKGLNPLKFKEKFKASLFKYYNLNSCGILKSSQWAKLFIEFISSSLQILDIFRIREGTKYHMVYAPPRGQLRRPQQ